MDLDNPTIYGLETQVIRKIFLEIKLTTEERVNDTHNFSSRSTTIYLKKVFKENHCGLNPFWYNT